MFMSALVKVKCSACSQGSAWAEGKILNSCQQPCRPTMVASLISLQLLQTPSLLPPRQLELSSSMVAQPVQIRLSLTHQDLILAGGSQAIAVLGRCHQDAEHAELHQAADDRTNMATSPAPLTVMEECRGQFPSPRRTMDGTRTSPGRGAVLRTCAGSASAKSAR